MISGYLLLNPEKEVDLKKIRRYSLRMVVVLATFGFVFCIIEAAVSMGLSKPIDVILLSIRNLFEGKSWGHMWYIYMLLGLYLFTPLLRIFVREADSQTVKLTLGVLFGFTLLRASINTLFHLDLDPIIPTTSSYLFYYLVGYYIGIGKIRHRKGVSLAALFFGAAGYCFTLVLTALGYIPDLQGGYVSIAIYSMAVFGLSMHSAHMRSLARNPVVQSISKYSFGIYLLHPVFFNLLMKGFGITPETLPVGISEAFFFTIVLGGAYLSTRILCKMKPFRNLLL